MSLVQFLTELADRIASLERRLENSHRSGTVAEVDPAKHRIRLRLGGSDEQPFLSPWVPYSQIAGDMGFHTPPSKGQQMALFSPAGDLRQGLAVPMTWSDQAPSPSDKGDEDVFKRGKTQIVIRGDALILEHGRSSLSLTDGEAVLRTPRFRGEKG